MKVRYQVRPHGQLVRTVMALGFWLQTCGKHNRQTSHQSTHCQMLLHVLCHEIVGNVETQRNFFWLGIVYANKCESTLAQIAVVCVYVCRGFNTAEQLFLPIISFRFDSRVNRHESSKRLYRLKIGEMTIGYTIASVFDVGLKAIFVLLYFPVSPYIFSTNTHLHDGESGGNCVLK